MKRIIRLVLATLMVATTLQIIAISPAGAAFADEESFTATTLGAQWDERGNTIGGAFFQYPGGRAALSVPESNVSYEPWTQGNRAPSLRQATTDTDLDVVSVFASTPTKRFQMQGIVVADEASGDFLRFDVHFDGTNMQAFAAFIDDSTDTATQHINVTTPSAGHASYLRVRRVGNLYELFTSDNGIAWTSHGSFTQAMPVTSLAPFIANAVPGAGQNAPAYSGLIDYFGALDDKGTPDPLDDSLPASAKLGTADDTQSPDPDLVTFIPGTDRIMTRWNGPEPVTLDLSIAGVGSQSITDPFPDHQLTSTSLDPGTQYTLTLTLTDTAGNSSQKAFSVSTLGGANELGPEFDIWHGDSASFGDTGTSQRWVNITGALTSIEGATATLTYQLNGGATSSASVVTDARRLDEDGDFNIDLLRSTLIEGTNTVVLIANDAAGSRTRVVTFDYTSLAVAPSTLLAVDWSSATSVDAVGDVSDGQWDILSGGLRTVDQGYDRIVTFGDTSWTNYQIQTTFTHNGITTNNALPESFGPGVGIFLRWNGHNNTVDPGSQPLQGFLPDGINPDPFGAIGWWRDSGAAVARHEITDNTATSQDSDPFTLVEGDTYNIKAQAEGARYRVKIWKVGTAEPGTWLAQGDKTATADAGAIAVVAHEMNITFGNITVTPLGATTAATPTFTPGNGVVNEGDTIDIGTESEGRVFYTTDGSTPTPFDEEAKFGITVADGSTVKAIQYVDGKDPSIIASATFTINGAPDVDAGADAVIDAGNAATLDATVSDDGVGGGSLVVAWRKVSGPGTVTFANDAIPDTTATFSSSGVYVLALDANDGSILRTDTLTITVDSSGYWLVDEAGNIYNFGGKDDLGDVAGGTLANPISTMAATPDGGGYWISSTKGKIDAFGTAVDSGDLPGLGVDPAFPIVNMAANPNAGYYLLGGDGGVFAFGGAKFFGSTGAIALAEPVVSMAATPSGLGYWFSAADGGMFAFGDAEFFGSVPGVLPAGASVDKPVVGMASTASGRGYWLVASDGGLFAFGDAEFFGSVPGVLGPGVSLNQPIVGMVATATGRGYWLVASDGGVFAFGDAEFIGVPGTTPAPIAALAS